MAHHVPFNNLHIEFIGHPTCSPQLVCWLLGKVDMSFEYFIFLSWAIFYVEGLNHPQIRTLLSGMYLNVNTSMLPWKSSVEKNDIKWFPLALTKEWQYQLLEVLYDHWFKLCFLNQNYYVDYCERQGLTLKCRKSTGVILDNCFDVDSCSGILIKVQTLEQKHLVDKLKFESFYQIVKNDKLESFAYVGPQSLMNHRDISKACILHIENNSRAVYFEWKFEFWRHSYVGMEETEGINHVVYTNNGLKISQQAFPDGPLTTEEREDGKRIKDRNKTSDFRALPNITKIQIRCVTRGTYVKDLALSRFNEKEELVVKYSNDIAVACNPNKRLRLSDLEELVK